MNPQNKSNHFDPVNSQVIELSQQISHRNPLLFYICVFIFILAALINITYVQATPVHISDAKPLNKTLKLKLSEFESEQDFKQKLVLGNELITLLDSPDTQVYLANLLLEQATIHLDLSNYDKSIPLAERAIAIAEENNYVDSLVTGYNRLAEAYWNQGNLEKALQQLEDYLRIARREDMKSDISSALHNIGLIYRHLGAPDKTLIYYLQAIELKEVISPNSPSLGHSYNNIGVVYFDLEDFENAEKSYLKAIEILEQDPMANIANPLHNLGQLFDAKGDMKTALEYYFSSLEYERKHKNKRGIAVSHREIGRIYLEHGEVTKSSHFLVKAKELSDSLDSLMLKADANLELGKLRLAEGNTDEAKKLMVEALKQSDEAKNKETSKEVNLSLYQLYSRTRDYEKALQHFKAYHDTQLTISENDAKKALKNLESQKAIELHKQEAEKLLREKELQQEILDRELSLSRIWLVVAFVIFVTVILIVIVLFMRRNLAQKERINRDLIELDRMKDNFLSTTSHELLTPINGIVGLSQTIEFLEPNLSEESKASLGIINSCGFRLSNLIKNILDMSSIQRGSFHLNRVTTTLDATIEKAINTLEPLANEKGLSIEKTLESPSIDISVDIDKIEQVLFNIIGNAIKYTHDGKISLRLVKQDSLLKIIIKDTGCGISSEDSHTLFQAFSTIKTEGFNPGGAGLGLAVSKAVVERHGGTLEYEKSAEVGSTFSVALPINNKMV